MRAFPHIFASWLLFIGLTAHASPALTSANELKNGLQKLVNAEHRSLANKSRNKYRHPVETLTFFGLAPSMAVVEVWPGTGWYTEILAPAVKEKGRYYAAHFSPNQQGEFFENMRTQFKQKLESDPEHYSEAVLTSLYPPGADLSKVPAGSIDLVLTFRNVHNWTKGGFDQEMFNAFHMMLKPGGILGVVEHRALAGTSLEDMIESGYMTEAYVIGLAEKAGFKLFAKSEVNSNDKDSTQHPAGVWSLPPTLREGEKNKEKYLEIGESDRMTLKFIKIGQ